ncbi:Intraflagellar transport protein 20 [Blomia tropicalis]|nr:Intraflagellar transport protein 20 [Blomia tropicalis]
MSDVLSRVGLYIDNQNEIRLLEPSIYQRSIELRDLSDQFMAKNGDFRDSVSGFIDGLSQIADQVEREKLQASVINGWYPIRTRSNH